MLLDAETYQLLGWGNMWPKTLAWSFTKRETKRWTDRVRMRLQRSSIVVKTSEAQYQKTYAESEAGKERRRAASRAYRARLKEKRMIGEQS